jgi:hypothetical protein
MPTPSRLTGDGYRWTCHRYRWTCHGRDGDHNDGRHHGHDGDRHRHR